MTLSIQFITMVTMVASGVYLGVVLDTFYRLVSRWKKRKILLYALEISFWIVQAIVLFYILFRVNAGEIRIYVFLAFLLGFSAYQALFKNIYLRVLEQLIKVMISILGMIHRCIVLFVLTPIRWIILLCTTIIVFLYRIIYHLLNVIWKILFFPFRLLMKIIQPYIPKKFTVFFHKLMGIYSTIKQTTKKWLEYITFKRR